MKVIFDMEHIVRLSIAKQILINLSTHQDGMVDDYFKIMFLWMNIQKSFHGVISKQIDTFD